eukprot:SAG31_NODE_30261_length_383_cov_1.073944_1_plen_102_part_01
MPQNQPEELTAKTKSRMANVIYAHMCANIVGICIILQGRPMLVLKNCNGDNVAMASLLSNMSAGVGLLEFLLNPICGRLADSFGRLRFIYASPLVNCLLKAA